MQIYWNKRKSSHKKRATPTGLVWYSNGRRFIVLEHQYGCHDVMCIHSISVSGDQSSKNFLVEYHHGQGNGSVKKE